jgi:hypothetical protein
MMDPLQDGEIGFAALWPVGARMPTKLAADATTAKTRRFQVVADKAFFIMSPLQEWPIQAEIPSWEQGRIPLKLPPVK